MTSLRTSREFVQEVVALADEGLTYEEIAEALCTSRNVVNHAISALSGVLKIKTEKYLFSSNLGRT